MSFKNSKTPKVAFSRNIKDIFFALYLEKKKSLDIFTMSLDQHHSEHSNKKIDNGPNRNESIGKDFLEEMDNEEQEARLFLSLTTDKLKKMFMTGGDLIVITETKIFKVNSVTAHCTT